MVTALQPARSTFYVVAEKYQQLRNAVYTATAKAFPALPFTCRQITFNDAMIADQWRAQWPVAQKKPIWSWVDLYNRCQKYNLLKRFEIALVANGKPVALCYGVPSKHKVLLKIHAIARDPLDNPLSGKALHVILFAAIAYADLIGSKEIWLVAPMNATLVEKYQRYGYKPVQNKMGRVTHLVLKVDHE